jgi:hypothetical protein
MEWKDLFFNLFLISREGVEEINRFKSLSAAGKFEALLFSSNIVLNVYRKSHPLTFSLVQGGYFEHLDKYIQENDCETFVEDIGEFMNRRFVLYSEELNNANNPNYIMGKTYNAFYSSPFCPDPENNFDLLTIIPFSGHLRRVVKTLISSVEILINQTVK